MGLGVTFAVSLLGLLCSHLESDGKETFLFITEVRAD